MLTLATYSILKITSLNTQDLSNTAWAFARNELQHAPLMHTIAAATLSRRSSAVDARSLSLILWSVVKLDCSNQPLMAAFASASFSRVSDAGPQVLSNTVWAYATCRAWDESLLETIALSALSLMGEFGQQELGNTAWAFAELSVKHLPLLAAIADRVRAPALRQRWRILMKRRAVDMHWHGPSDAWVGLLYREKPCWHSCVEGVLLIFHSGYAFLMRSGDVVLRQEALRKPWRQ